MFDPFDLELFLIVWNTNVCNSTRNTNQSQWKDNNPEQVQQQTLIYNQKH